MSPGNRAGGEPHYYSSLLRRKLDSLLSASAAVVEAPSGYGKTTAVRDTLETRLPTGSPVFWITAADEAPMSGFRRLCRIIEKIDGHAGQRLLKTGLPNSATVGEACDAVRAIQCPDQAYLIIDNFQLWSDHLPASFLTALLEHGGQCLHIIIVTQILRRNVVAFVEGHGILYITAADLRLSASDISSYYAGAGVAIAPEDAQRVARSTEGWIAAVYLHLCAFRTGGSFLDMPGILTLMEHLLWEGLSPEQKDFLLRLSPFNTVTWQQACQLCGWETLPEYAREALQNPFIHYEYGKRCYELHSILSELLIQKRGERGISFERECLRRAGDFCRSRGKTSAALGFYAKISDYENILSLDLSHMILEDIGDRPFWELALRIARNCPSEIKKKHILSLLRIAWALLLSGEKAECRKLMEDLRLIIDGGARDGKNHLLGEWLLLSSFDRYPDLDEMTAVLKQAEPFLTGGRSQVILPSSPLCLGNYVMFTEFHSRPGEAEQEAAALEKYIAVYSRLTNGHGSGADALFRSALAYYRLDLSGAEILAYKAAYLAESNGQSFILLGAAHVLAEIALQKGDISGWQNAVNSMERAASSDAQNHSAFRSSVDIVRGVLFCELQAMEKIAPWLRAGEFSPNHVLPSMLNTALFVYFTSLHFQGQYEPMIGKIQAVISGPGSSNPLFNIILYFLMAIGYIKIGQAAEARKCLEQAADMAIPDGLLFFFVAYSWLLEGLPDRLIEEKYPSLKDHFADLKRNYLTGWRVLYNDMFSASLPADLTEREFEVARLAAAGLHNSEIAEKLMVTENTVRFHLRTIFQKLDIDRRAKLAEKLK